MKKLNFLLSILSILMMVSCSPKEEIDYAIVKGTIQNNDAGKLWIRDVDRETTELKVNEQGAFVDTIKAGEFSFIYERNYAGLYALAGSVIEISVDAKDFDNTLTLGGDLVSFNQYLITKTKLSNDERAKMQETFTLEETAFMKVAKENTAALIKEFEKVTGIPDSLKELEKKSVEMKYYSDLAMYVSYYPYMSKDNSYKPSETLLAELDKVNLDDEKLYRYSSDYYMFTRNYLSIKGNQLYKEEGLSSEVLGFFKVLNTLNSQYVKNKLGHITMLQRLADAEDKDALYEEFKKCCNDEKSITEVTELYNKVGKLDKGKPSPKFVDYENCAGGTSSLDDFKGKYVYIDVWATWCGPCRAEIPHLKKVEHKYHGKKIEFVSISVDVEKDKEKWKKMVADKELGGVQLIANNKEFTDAYAVSGIPRFILIDPEGNIVSKSAPRPSNPELITLFNALGI
ncbi:TlpA family protein disulfide reductase [Saccharicrinis sp. GN24d3]|uniref:TlpA family protein disulfide reductase n=1 Tax=Saccharicrinis sp. GN24d3 TaxID=3458416 RepID=UPI004037040C